MTGKGVTQAKLLATVCYHFCRGSTFSFTQNQANSSGSLVFGRNLGPKVICLK